MPSPLSLIRPCKPSLLSLLSSLILSSISVLPHAYAAESGKLLIWVNGDKAHKGIAKLAEAYSAETGIPVSVEHPEDAASKFQQLAASGRGPDIFLWAHDRIGEWVSAGLLAPIHTSKAMRRSIEPMAWNAFTVRAKTWGYPISMEAVALIYNKDLLAAPPKNLEEIPALDKKLRLQGKQAIDWDYTNAYFSWPLLAAGGGYAFGHWDSGHYDAANTGVANAGAQAGMQAILKLVQAEVLPKTANYGEMEKNFHEGKLAMMINGPWAWENARRAKINFGVALIPAVNGKAARPFVGVQGAMIAKHSPNQAQAVNFLENHLLTVAGLKTMHADVPLGVPANRKLFETLKADPLILATMHSVQHGEPMPNNPEMGKFWSATKTALESVTQGKQTSAQALEQAARQILAGAGKKK